MHTYKSVVVLIQGMTGYMGNSAENTVKTFSCSTIACRIGHNER